jgi:hypothetical protein
MLSVIKLSVAFSYCYAERHYAECRYAECRGAQCTVIDNETLSTRL